MTEKEIYKYILIFILLIGGSAVLPSAMNYLIKTSGPMTILILLLCLLLVIAGKQLVGWYKNEKKEGWAKRDILKHFIQAIYWVFLLVGLGLPPVMAYEYFPKSLIAQLLGGLIYLAMAFFLIKKYG
ncbi:MAG: hypothetical protein UY04_C0012G0013 [Parcubacteria group bacterium GW2011_GWA2_47_7]|nr:MAG: hypothetical protein UY04_C0012G0013 [Parcubacteria group bacterium GW2011_GWA2_47_7]